jgi:hypothetical protein
MHTFMCFGGKREPKGGTSSLLGSHESHIFAVHKGPIRLWLPRQHLDENSWRELRRSRSRSPCPPQTTHSSREGRSEARGKIRLRREISSRKVPRGPKRECQDRACNPLHSPLTFRVPYSASPAMTPWTKLRWRGESTSRALLLLPHRQISKIGRQACSKSAAFPQDPPGKCRGRSIGTGAMQTWVRRGRKG